jgi:hypothetical protein
MGEGTVKDILAAYRGSVEAAAKVADSEDGLVRVTSLEIDSPDSATPTTQHPLELRFQVQAQSDTNSRVFVGISEGTADPIFVFRKHVQLSHEGTDVTLKLPRLPLPRGRYYVWFGAVDHTRGMMELSPWHPLTHFDVYGPELDAPPTAVVRRAPVHAESEWEVANTSDVWQRERGGAPSVGGTERRFGT